MKIGAGISACEGDGGRSALFDVGVISASKGVVLILVI